MVHITVTIPVTRQRNAMSIPRLSASVILLRRAVSHANSHQSPANAAFSVLLIQRNRRMSFAAGMFSFPGGVLEAADDGDLACCAARECFEEVGIL